MIDRHSIISLLEFKAYEAFKLELYNLHEKKLLASVKKHWIKFMNTPPVVDLLNEMII